MLSEIATRSELAGYAQVVPAGSKVNLAATVAGMREALGTMRVFAVRDRDFLRTEHLSKDESKGVYSLRRYSIESYMLEPASPGTGLRARCPHPRRRSGWAPCS